MKCNECVKQQYCSMVNKPAGQSVCHSCKNCGKDLEVCEKCCLLSVNDGHCSYEPHAPQESVQTITSSELAECLEEIYYTEYDGSDDIEDFLSWLKSADFVKVKLGGDQ